MNSERMVVDVTTEAELDAALEAARLLADRPTIIAAEYNAATDIVICRLDNGLRLAIPREQLQGLEDATHDDLAEIEIFGGVEIYWPRLDVNHYLPHLLEGKYSTEKWQQEMAARRSVAA